MKIKSERERGKKEERQTKTRRQSKRDRDAATGRYIDNDRSLLLCVVLGGIVVAWLSEIKNHDRFTFGEQRVQA